MKVVSVKFLHLCLALVLLSAPVRAEVPRVVADIAPVHALVAQVMQGLGTPDLILRPGISPHGYAMRPSQARALQNADLVVWIGPQLTPWLAKPMASLAPQAAKLTLLEAEATHRLVFRGADEHDHGHDEGHDDGEGGPEPVDPHAWLDPENGRIWLGLIADRLALADPDNAALYHANAQAGQAELTGLQSELVAVLAPVQDRAFVTFHDAYQYFETRFGLHFAGAVTLSDAADPSPAQLARLRDTLVEKGITCAFSEPQFDPALLAAIGGEGLTILSLDPMGSTLEPGAGFYSDLLRNMAGTFASCSAR